MDVLINFLKDNLMAVISLLFVIASFIVGIVRKKGSMNLSDAIKSQLAEDIPQLINMAEISQSSGVNKKDFVCQVGVSKVAKLLGVSLSIAQTEYWTRYISEQVELILSTPSKKGQKNEK